MIDLNKTTERVKALMAENGMNTKNEMLVINVCIIYTQAQKDQLLEDREQLKEGK